MGLEDLWTDIGPEQHSAPEQYSGVERRSAPENYDEHVVRFEPGLVRDSAPEPGLLRKTLHSACASSLQHCFGIVPPVLWPEDLIFAPFELTWNADYQFHK